MTGDTFMLLSLSLWLDSSFDPFSESLNTLRGKLSILLLDSLTLTSPIISSSYDGYLRSHEGYFYLLDALPLFIPLAIWVLIWPPQYIGNNPKSFSRADEVAHANSRYSDQSVGDLVKKY
jgi:hypothetical protein